MSSPNEFTVLTWPPKSLYPNPVEHLWDVMKINNHIMYS